MSSRPLRFPCKHVKEERSRPDMLSQKNSPDMTSQHHPKRWAADVQASAHHERVMCGRESRKGGLPTSHGRGIACNRHPDARPPPEARSW